MDRYHRQTLLPQVGPKGRERLAAARVLLVGCGALGTVLADQLVRAGVGLLRLVDRDVVEWSNLQRQVLFDEADASQGTPKAVAAARRLASVNSSVVVEPVVADVNAANIEELVGEADLILDGTDNAETRYLVNDVSVMRNVPWVYGACVGTEGRMMSIRPGVGPCLRCVFPEPPGPGELPTCDTAGVLAPAAAIVASLQAVAALRLLIGGGAGEDHLISLDVWKGRFHSTPLELARREDCRACALRQFDFLTEANGGQLVHLCGRNAVQVRPYLAKRGLDLKSLATRLQPSGTVQLTPHLLRFREHDAADWKFTLFPDGRAMIHGTQDPTQAKSQYAKWVGA